MCNCNNYCPCYGQRKNNNWCSGTITSPVVTCGNGGGITDLTMTNSGNSLSNNNLAGTAVNNNQK